MTYTLNTANHNGCTIDRPVTQWPTFDSNGEYRGHIHRIAAWAVPKAVHKSLKLQDNLDLFLTTEGHWAPTLEIAEHLLINTEPAKEFIVKGSTLSLFVAPQWAEENGSPNTHSDYRVFRMPGSYWDADEVQGRVLAAAGNEF